MLQKPPIIFQETLNFRGLTHKNQNKYRPTARQKFFEGGILKGLADADLQVTQFNSEWRQDQDRAITFFLTGSPRQMFELHQDSQDSMSYVRKYSKPDLFTTITCNPKWEENSFALLLNQKSTDCPDLTVKHIKTLGFFLSVCPN